MWKVTILVLLCMNLCYSNSNEYLLKVLDFTKANNACNGYFSMEQHPYQTNAKIDAAQLKYINNTLIVTSNVNIHYKHNFITTELAKVLLNDKRKINTINFPSNSRIINNSLIIVSNSATLDLINHRGLSKEVIYRIQYDSLINNENKIYAWGEAEQIAQIAEHQYTGEQVYFSTCSPVNPTWKIYAKKLQFDQQQEQLVLRNVVVQVGKVPVFYTPYLSFPTNSKRKTGVLIPEFNFAGKYRGYIALPLYFNVAPNYDATITPSIRANKIVKVDSEFRWLTKQTNATLGVEYVPFDTISKNSLLSNSRGRVNLSHTYQITDNLASKLAIDYVSDDDYLIDFNSFNQQNNNFLTQELQVKYDNNKHMATFKLIAYQLLQPKNSINLNAAYFKLPEIEYSYNKTKLFSTWYFTHAMGVVNYVHSKRIKNNFYNVNRIYIQPTLSQEFNGKYGNLITKVDFNVRNYHLLNNGIVKQRTLTKYTPIYTIDLLLNFANRDVAVHTLQPRIQYTYIPYVEQNMIPAIDTGYRLLTVDNLFNSNRFTNLNRIGDTNKLTYGCSYIWNALHGRKLAKLTIAQSYYFTKRLVTLSNSNNEHKYLGYRDNNSIFSPLAVNLIFTPNNNFSWGVDITVPYKKQYSFDMFSTKLQYKFANNNVINLGYELIKNGDQIIPNLAPSANTKQLNKLTASGAISITADWSVFATGSYNLDSNSFEQYFVGFEYDSCCVVLRFLAGKELIGRDRNSQPKLDKKISVQFVLKGLGSYNINKIAKLLEYNIPGYNFNRSN